MFLFENRQRRKYERTVNKAVLHPGTLLVMWWDTCAGGCVLLCCWSWHFRGWAVRAHGAESPNALLLVCEPFVRGLPGQMKSTAHGKSLLNVNPIFVCLVSVFLPFCLLSWAFVEDVENGIGSCGRCTTWLMNAGMRRRGYGAAAPPGCTWAHMGLLVGHGEHWEQNVTCLLLDAALKNSYVLYCVHCRSSDCGSVGKCSLVLIEFSNKTFLRSSSLNW